MGRELLTNSVNSMPHQKRIAETWPEVLAEAKRRCDPQTQKALALELQVFDTHLSNVINGHRKLTPEQIEKLAALIEREPSEIWHLQGLDQLERTNPFVRGLASLGALLLTCMASVLLVGAIALNPSRARENAASYTGDGMHIVAILRHKSYCVLGTLAAIAALIRERLRRIRRHAQSIAGLAPHLARTGA